MMDSLFWVTRILNFLIHPGVVHEAESIQMPDIIEVSDEPRYVHGLDRSREQSEHVLLVHNIHVDGTFRLENS